MAGIITPRSASPYALMEQKTQNTPKTAMDEPPAAHTLLRRRQVEMRVGLRRSAIYLRLTNGTFPKPIRLGPRSVRWIASEVDAWIAERVAQSRPASPDEARP